MNPLYLGSGSDLSFDSSDWDIGGSISLPLAGGGQVNLSGGAAGASCSTGNCPAATGATVGVGVNLPVLLLLAAVLIVAFR